MLSRIVAVKVAAAAGNMLCLKEELVNGFLAGSMGRRTQGTGDGHLAGNWIVGFRVRP
jgi:hypothetical protein